MAVLNPTLHLRRATAGDIAAMAALYRANANDLSLFQQSAQAIRNKLDEFTVAEINHRVVGCACLHHSHPHYREILGVVVHPDYQGLGIGKQLLQQLLAQVKQTPGVKAWLGTSKPEYFQRFGFKAIRAAQLPLFILLKKFPLVFTQPVARWLPTLFGRHTLMQLQ